VEVPILKQGDFLIATIQAALTDADLLQTKSPSLDEQKTKIYDAFMDEGRKRVLARGIKENISWKCRQLVVGTGAYGKLPVQMGTA
jgi:hypothetical protein